MRCASSALEDSIMQILTFLFSMRELRRGITVGENYKKSLILTFKVWILAPKVWKYYFDPFLKMRHFWWFFNTVRTGKKHNTANWTRYIDTHTQKSQKLSKKTRVDVSELNFAFICQVLQRKLLGYLTRLFSVFRFHWIFFMFLRVWISMKMSHFTRFLVVKKVF